MKKLLLLILTAVFFTGSCAKDDGAELPNGHTSNTEYQIVFVQNQGIKCMDANGNDVFRLDAINSQSIQGISLSANSQTIVHSAFLTLSGPTMLGSNCSFDQISFSEIYYANAPTFEFKKVTSIQEQIQASEECAPFSHYTDLSVSSNGTTILAVKHTIFDDGSRDNGRLVSIDIETKSETEIDTRTNLGAGEVAEVYNTKWSGTASNISGFLYVTDGNTNESRLFFSDSDGSNLSVHSFNESESLGEYIWATDQQSIYMRTDNNSTGASAILEIGMNGAVLNTLDFQGTGIHSFDPQAIDTDNVFIYGNARLENNESQVIKLNINTAEYSVITDHGSTQSTIVHAISPDGQWILYSVAVVGDAGFSLWKVRIDGSESTQLTSAGNVFSAKWIQTQ